MHIQVDINHGQRKLVHCIYLTMIKR